MMIDWAGPLFYPPVAKIAVMRSGARIEIWPNESEAGCFTGLLLDQASSHSKRIAFDLSCLWDCTCIDHIEEPTPDDLQLTEFARAA
jgi:hypothetical protein